MADNKWVSNNTLTYFLEKLKGVFVAKETGKGLSSNDLTDELKSNYDGAYTHSQSSHAPSNAERNIIIGIQKNGTDITPTNRKVNIEIPDGVSPSTVAPKMDGTATVGTSTDFARGDHVHPKDTSKVDKVTGKGLSTNDFTDALKGNYDTAYTHSQATHAPTDAEKNSIVGVQVNNTDLTIDASRKVNVTVPTKVSDLNNDSGFITGVNDATTTSKGLVKVGTNISVSNGTISVSNASTSAKGVVQLSDATNSTSTTIGATANAVKKAYDLANGKQSPATSLSGYGITDAYTKAEVDNKLTSAVKYKGTVASYSDLPTTGQLVGDMYNVTSADKTHNIKAGDNVVWSGTEWDIQGGVVDLSGCVQVGDFMTNTEVDALFS